MGIYTRKVSLKLVNESDEASLIKLHQKINEASNDVVNETFLTWLTIRRESQTELLAAKKNIKSDQQLTEEDKKKAIAQGYSNFKEKYLIGMRGEPIKSPDGLSYNFLSLKYSGEIPNNILTAINRNITKTLQSQRKDIMSGKKSLPNYTNNQPIPINFHKKKFPITKINDGDYRLFPFGEFEFKINFGKDSSSNKTIIDRLIYFNDKENKDYSLCDSSIQIEYNKFKKTPTIEAIYFLLIFKLKENNFSPDKNLVMGINLGINTPVYYHIKGTKVSGHIGEYKEFYKEKIQRTKRQRIIQKSLTLGSKSGEGRSNKIKTLYNLKKSARNWTSTFNHRLSSEIIKICLKNNAGTIHLEDLSNINTKFTFLKQWPYYQLQQYIKYKAKKNNIEVHEIKAYFNSITCHCCKKKGERKSSNYNMLTKMGKDEFIKEFHFWPTYNVFVCHNIDCENFNNPINIDKNAAINAAESNNFKNKKKEEEFV